MVSDANEAVPPVRPAVGGWLLLLCLLLVFVSPVSALYSVFWLTLPKLVTATTADRIILLSVYCCAFLALAICSVWTGLKLWMVHPNADKVARMYILGYLITNIVYFAFWYFLVGPRTTLGLAQMAWYHVVGPVGSSALWYFYLENSSRVRETYSSDQ